MPRITGLQLGLFVLLLGTFVLGQEKGRPLLPAEVALPLVVKELSVEELDAMLRRQPSMDILDVRTIEEYRGLGFIPRAKHFDFFHFDHDYKKQLAPMGIDPAKPILVYCALGGRARRAALEMAQEGYQLIYLLKGGFDAWKAAGKKLEKDQG